MINAQISRYVALHRSLGRKFFEQERLLRKFGTYATRCIYRADGTSAPTTKCYYLTSNKAKQYDVVSVPVVYDQPTMQIRVTRAALESAFAYGARASYYSGNYKTVNEICTAGLNNLKAGGLTASWKMVCVN